MNTGHRRTPAHVHERPTPAYRIRLRGSKRWMRSSVAGSSNAPIDEYLAKCGENGDEPGKPFSGKPTLNAGGELHGAVAADQPDSRAAARDET